MTDGTASEALLKQATAEKLAELQRLVPLDVIVELVEHRHRESVRTQRRWLIGIVVTVAVAYGAVLAQVTKTSPEDLRMAGKQDEVAGDVSPAVGLDSSSVLTLGNYDTVRVSSGEATYRTFSATLSGLYEIDVLGDGGPSDPKVTLYEIADDQVSELASDDDGGAGLNSRLLAALKQNTRYTLSITAWNGADSEFQVRVQLIAATQPR